MCVAAKRRASPLRRKHPWQRQEAMSACGIDRCAQGAIALLDDLGGGLPPQASGECARINSVPGPFRMAELLAALSLAADLGTGALMETTLRICVLATRVADVAKADADELAATYYTGLLWSAGCTSTAHEEHIRFGDDISLKRAMAGADFERPAAALRRPASIGADLGLNARLHAISGLLRYGRTHGDEVARFHCEAGARLASRFGLGAKVLEGLGGFFEYWDGKGGPSHTTGDSIPFAARATRVAYEAGHALAVGDDPAALVGSRAGRELDPALCQIFQRHAGEVLAGLEQESIWSAALDLEPEPRLL